MPLWSDLGATLGAELRDHSPLDPLNAISAYEHEFKRPKLVERLSELLLVNEAQPGKAHRAFCSIPFGLVCTTNFDFLLEREYERLGRPCTPLVNEDQLSINVEDMGAKLFKIHADLHHPSRMVLTEDDYDRFLHTYPLLATFFAYLLITKTAVLIGYSLDDPDLRQVWRVVADRLGSSRRAAYAIGVGVKPMVVSRYQRRGIQVINLPGSTSAYPEVLAAAFTELGEFWRRHPIAANQVKEERSLRELSLPPGASRRLCYFSVPMSSLSFYREHVFPVARERGLVPVSVDDVVSSQDTMLATIEALIQRAQLFVVEASNQSTLFEFAMARARLDMSRILVIASPETGRSFDLMGYRVIPRPNVLAIDPGEFLRAVGKWFTDAAHHVASDFAEEPQRLFAAKEYRAAVIAAISLLEVSLRRRVDEPSSLRERRMPLPSLLKIAQEQGLLGEVPRSRVVSWLRVRNRVVHGQRTVSKAVAESIVKGVAKIVDDQ